MTGAGGLDLDWRPRAASLADTVCASAPEWRDAVAATPRHVLVPCWWTPTDGYLGWDLHDGASDPTRWLDTAFADQTVITRVGPLHADHATPGERATGEPTSSSTLPGLVVIMLRHLDARPGMRVLDVATGSGYSAALLTHRLGDHNVVSVDVDPYLTSAAAGRLAAIGHLPRVEAADATGALPADDVDRLVAMVSVRPIPASWLTALRPGGKVVTTLAGTSLLLRATRQEDGTATGRVVPDVASFMPTRRGEDYPPRLDDLYGAARDADGDEIRISRLPMPDFWTDWPARTLLELAVDGVEERSVSLEDGRRILWLLHSSGSWARAESDGIGLPRVHQSGSRGLWDEFERAHARWEETGRVDLRRLAVTVETDGTIYLTRGRWRITLTPVR